MYRLSEDASMGESAAPFGENDTGQPAHKKIFELPTGGSLDLFARTLPRLVLSNLRVI